MYIYIYITLYTLHRSKLGLFAQRQNGVRSTLLLVSETRRRGTITSTRLETSRLSRGQTDFAQPVVAP